MERRRAEMESSVAGPSATSVAPTLGSDVTLTPIRALVLGPDVTPVPISHFQPLDPMSLCLLEKLSFRSKHPMSRLVRRVPLSHDSGFGGCGRSHASSSRKEEGDRLGTSRVQRCSTIEGRSRAGAAGSARKRCTRSEEGEVSARLSQHRSKVFVKTFFPLLSLNSHILSCDQFVSLIDGMLGDCGLEVTRLSKELDSSRETLKRTEAVLQSIESTHAAQTSTLEARISDLERDLGKTVSSLLKAKEEKKSKSSEVRRLKRRIQRFEEMGTCTAAELAGPSSSGTLVPGSEIPEVQDAGIVADKGGEEVGEGDGEAVPALGESGG
ncbi:Uncharacterized protein Rs2_35688 [Raphanus sativus]|nr:Uncharacterized protein Rs2_35688 [Raphanus sativus]